MTAKATVVVIDDDPAVRDSMSLMLEEQDYAVETFESAEAFLACNRQIERGCAIIDVRMPGLDGMQLQAEIAVRHLALPVIFLTGHGDIPMSVRAIKAGAVDFLTKPVTVPELLKSVQAALLESDRLNLRIDVNQSAVQSVQSLTQREREIMIMVVQGLANKEIARLLGISHRTVEQHRGSVMRKVGADTLVDLMHVAELSGLRKIE